MLNFRHGLCVKIVRFYICQIFGHCNLYILFVAYVHEEMKRRESNQQNTESRTVLVEDKVNVVEDKVNVVEDKVNIVEDKVNVVEDKVNVVEDSVHHLRGEHSNQMRNCPVKYHINK